MQSVILVTGAGTGIGKLTAQSLAEAGHIVYASMRDIAGRNNGRAAELRTLASAKGLQLHPLELDVLSQSSADAAAATIVGSRAISTW
jgi:NAD(P)-dependent dehydrogenase (short-subunit alcohol dehydrogenase family)